MNVALSRHLSCVNRWGFAIALLGLASLGISQTGFPLVPLKMALPPGISKAKLIGRMPASAHLNISVSLRYRDPQGIQQFVNSVSNPQSRNYRQFITPAEVGKRFGPLATTVSKVTSYLATSGMTVKLVGDNGLTILADATVAQAETAFRTQIGEFSSAERLSPPGGHLFAFTATPSLPANLQPYVIEIGGLENFTHPKPFSYVTPPQIQTLYGLSPMYSVGSQGQGRTIGISSWDGYRLSNVPYEYSQFGLPAPAGGVGSNITIEKIDGGSGTGNEQGEADLDIQSILGVAPLCNLIIYDGSGGDLITVLTQEANDNKADVISESYGWMLSSSTALAAHNLHLSMSAEGITYMAASGDSGTTLNYYYPDTEPEVLLVGGTTCSVDSQGNRISETGWSGSGGGWKATSDPFNTLPSYQTGTGVPTNIPYRLIPDVALNADPNSGYVVYLDGGFYIIGGTSGASPTFAGSLGDSEQQLIANGALAVNGAGTYRMGRIQDLLYSFNGDPSVFYDVTSGGNGNLPSGTASTAGTGWDFVTGWGAMNFSGFVTELSGTGLTQFTVSPSSVEGGQGTVTGTVSMPNQAPTGGTAITISGGDGSIAYPSTVTIPAGSRSATFSITTSAVSATDTESLSATDGTNTRTATLTLTPSPISGFSFSPSLALGGTTFTGTITLLHAAAGAGDVVALSGGDSFVSYPSTVTVPAGSTTATFAMTSSLTPSSDPETITATLSPSAKTATVTLSGLAVSSLTLSPTSVMGGTAVTGTVNLSAAAPAGGIVVAITGGDGSVTYPTSVTVPANTKSVAFKITTAPVTANTVETLNATMGASVKSASFTITAPTISSFAFSPTSVFGGVSSTGTIAINGPAGSSGLSIVLSGGDSSIGYPSTVTVPAGAKAVSFTATTSVVATQDVETISANLAGGSHAATLTIKPAGVVSSLSFSPSSVVGGKNTVGTVRLTTGAGPQGVVVSLTGGDSNISYPATVSIASGASSATFTVTTTMVTANDVENLTATIGPSSANGSFTLLATAVTSLTFSPSSVFGGVSSTGTVTLNGPAGSSGLTVALSGGDSSVSYPSTVSIPSGASSATFTVATSIVASTDTETLKAALFASSVSGVLTIKPPGVVSSLTFSPSSLVGGLSTTGTVRLTGGAGPQGVTVTLSGGDSSISYPSSIFIASGVSSGTFTVTTSQITANDVENLVATIGPSSAKGSFTVLGIAVSRLTFSPTSVFGGVSSIGTVNLNGPAGSSGLTVALSGGDSAVSYPSTVTIPSGATSASFTIATSIVPSADSESIQAALYSSSVTGVLSIKPAGVVSSLTFSPASVVGGLNTTGTVKLTAGAGPQGVTVSLTGGDSTISYPSTISIPSGASSATFAVTTTQGSASVTENLVATLGPSTAKGAFTVLGTKVASLILSPNSVFGGVSSTGTVTLNGPAGQSGLTVALSGGDSNVGYPTSVAVPAGASSATFTVTTSVVASNDIEALRATLYSTFATATLTVKPAGVLSSLTFSPASVVGGGTTTGTVRLTGGAGPQGVTIALSGGDSSIGYPSSIFIASGASTGTFAVTTSAVSANAIETLTASLGSTSVSGSFTVMVPTLLTFTVSPTSVEGGGSSTGTITLSGTAGSSGVVVAISGGDASIGYPATVTISPGSSSVTFTISTSSVVASKTEQIVAKLASTTKSASLKLTP